jgi:hypothetical protein
VFGVSPSQASQAKGAEFVGRISARTKRGGDADVTLTARNAQTAAIIEWGVRDFAKLSRLQNIQARPW